MLDVRDQIWRSVKYPPRTGDAVLVYTEEGRMGIAWYDLTDESWDSYDYSLSYDPFLYRTELPDPPQTEDRGRAKACLD